MTTALVPPLKWHGGKHYLAPRLVAMMPAATHYVEPYFGGGAVLLARDPEGVSEVVNDIYGELVNFWRVLASEDSFGRFRRLAEATPFSEERYRAAVARRASLGLLNDGADDAADFFVLCRQSLAGRMKSFAPLSGTRTRRGMNEQASAWINAVDGLADVHARLRRVVILKRPALDVIREQDGPGTLFYLDPPYLHETRATTGDYAHEMTGADHEALLRTLANVAGKFVLSGYRSELYDTAARLCDWRRMDFDLPNNAAGGESKRRMVESAWCNFTPTERGQ